MIDYVRTEMRESLDFDNYWCLQDLFYCQERFELRHDKTNKMSVRPAKTQISLGIRPVWAESSLCAQWVAKDPMLIHVDSEASDQTGWMPRLIWVFTGRTVTLSVLSCRGSFGIILDHLQRAWCNISCSIFHFHDVCLTDGIVHHF